MMARCPLGCVPEQLQFFLARSESAFPCCAGSCIISTLSVDVGDKESVFHQNKGQSMRHHMDSPISKPPKPHPPNFFSFT